MRPAIDDLPGFRRRFIITPLQGCVLAEVEDDYHRMGVALHHDGAVATRIEPVMDRAPWTTCPGAIGRLIETFTDMPLKDFVMRGEKTTNCTHLYDLALLASAHAKDDATTTYDILVSDPVEDGRRRAELRRNGETILSWSNLNYQLLENDALAGVRLDKLNPWIETLDAPMAEAARLLRWGTMLAHGRTIPIERQSKATEIPPNCYTFQPERAKHAIRIGKSLDFSMDSARLLEKPVAPR